MKRTVGWLGTAVSVLTLLGCEDASARKRRNDRLGGNKPQASTSQVTIPFPFVTPKVVNCEVVSVTKVEECPKCTPEEEARIRGSLPNGSKFTFNPCGKDGERLKLVTTTGALRYSAMERGFF